MSMLIKVSQFNAGSNRHAFGQHYDYFLPTTINNDFDVDVPALQTQLETSARRLGELNAMAKLVPDLRLFIQTFISNEATLSSRIEGTQTSLEDAFKKKESIQPEKRDDWLEVNLYIQALEQAIGDLSTLPLCNRLMQQAHKTLLSSGRGKGKLPGEFRRSQNWLGGSSLQTADFIPPHEQHVGELMADLEKFLNGAGAMPALIRIGIAHYQFETIHPFLDGNGRVGRMLIVLFLVQSGLLDKPLLYPSAFFEKYRQVYYEKLTRVRSDNDLAGWLLFFLEGVEKVAHFSIETLEQLLELKETLTKDIRANSGRRADNNLRALDFAFESPIFSARTLTEALKISSATANKVIATLIELKVLQNISSGRRHRQFIFTPYINIFTREFGE